MKKFITALVVLCSLSCTIACAYEQSVKDEFVKVNYKDYTIVPTSVHKYSNTITIPAGTPIVVYTEHEIDADDVRKGESLEFIVLEPLKINGIQVIKAGTRVMAQVVYRKNNFIFGVPGRLEVGNFHVLNPQTGAISLRGSIIDKGENRFLCNIGWLFLTPLLFIKGDDGKIPAGAYQTLYVAGDTQVELSDL